MVEITLGHQVWVGLVLVLDFSSNSVGGLAQGQVVVGSKNGFIFWIDYERMCAHEWAHRDLNPEPADYESVALPLSYGP